MMECMYVPSFVGPEPKATIVEAKSETNANLTKKRKSKTDTEPPVNAKKAKQIKAEVIISSMFPIMFTHNILSAVGLDSI